MVQLELIIAEKPSVAHAIAEALNIKGRKDGYFEGNNIRISWAIGHLFSQADPQTYDPKYEKWKLEDLPIIPEKIKLVPTKGALSQLKILKTLIQSSDLVINGCDSGREGEAIWRYIMIGLGVKNKKTKRLWTSSLAAEAIRKAYANLQPSENYDSLFASARVRAESDWLIGINATRAFTCKFPGQMLSIGRVQTPTLSMIYDRQKSIENFKPQAFFELEGVFLQEGNEYRGKWQGERILDVSKATELVDKVSNKNGLVTEVTSTEKKEFAPRLYDLTQLQRDASDKLSFTAKKTLDVAQQLYEKHKVATYPRTNSQYVTKDEIPLMHQAFHGLQGHYQDYSINGNVNLVHEKNKAICNPAKVEDHHAILPTGKVPNGLSKDEEALYQLIIKRFFAQFHSPARYMIHEALSTVENEVFKTSAKELKEVGWKFIFQSEEKMKEEEKPIDFSIKSGETFCSKVILDPRVTTPPKLFQEGTLISAMDNAGNDIEDQELKETLKETAGIGTPATRAAIIERLKKSEYIQTKGKNLIVTPKGGALIETIRKTELHILTSVELTAKWELALNKIAKGADPSPFENGIKQFTQKIIDVVNAQKSEGQLASSSTNEPIGTCPVCKGNVIEGKKGYGCSNYKQENGGCKFVIWKVIAKKKITPTMAKQLITKGETGVLKGFVSTKKEKETTFQAKLKLINNEVKFEFVNSKK